MNQQEIIGWLLEGDVSIQYQVHRDLLNNDRPELHKRITTEGWGKQFLAKRQPNGLWGDRFYQPKWISTHYTLLDLKNLQLPQDNSLVAATIHQVLNTHKAKDGGICLGPSTSVHSDVCVNAMFLNYAAYFQANQSKLESIVDSILAEKMPDGGFNCQLTRKGAVHSSLHTTLSVLEGIHEFIKAGHIYRIKELKSAKKSAEEFVLLHQFFLSDRTGKVIQNSFLRFPYPDRWKYKILRALDYFQNAGVEWDERMGAAVDVLLKKKRKDGRWNVNSAHSGQVHFEMEKAGQASRWNTLRALRIVKEYPIR